MTRLFFLFHKWRLTVKRYKPELQRQRELHKFHEVLTIAGVKRWKRQESKGENRSLSKFLQHRSSRSGMILEQKRWAAWKAQSGHQFYDRKEDLKGGAVSFHQSHQIHPRSDTWAGEKWSPLDIVALSVDMQQARTWTDWDSKIGKTQTALSKRGNTSGSLCDWKIVVFLDVPEASTEISPSLHTAAQVQWAQKWVASKFSKAQLRSHNAASPFNIDSETGSQLLSFYRAV